jgi:hypothetical protein
MATIAILGLGNFGTALARVWLLGGHDVRGWTVEEDVFDAIRSKGSNSKYLDGIDLTGLQVSMELGESVPGAELVVLALPSHVVLHVADDVIPLLTPDQVVLDLAKGIAGEELVSDAIQAKLAAAGKTNPLAVITGPTIAPELASGVLTTALVASEDESLASRLAEQLSTSTFSLKAASDPRGAELWGGFKNVIALGCGIADGLDEGSGDNLKRRSFRHRIVTPRPQPVPGPEAGRRADPGGSHGRQRHGRGGRSRHANVCRARRSPERDHAVHRSAYGPPRRKLHRARLRPPTDGDLKQTAPLGNGQLWLRGNRVP